MLSFAARPQATGAPVFHGVDDHRGPQPAFRNELFGYRVVRLGLALRVRPHFRLLPDSLGSFSRWVCSCLPQRQATEMHSGSQINTGKVQTERRQEIATIGLLFL